MYSVKFPDYVLADFFDEMLATREGAAYNFLKGRITSIKNILLEEEKEYLKLASPNFAGGLYDLEEKIEIRISEEEILGSIINVPNTISKSELIDLLKRKGISPIFNNLEEMSLDEIKNIINNTSLKQALNLIEDSNLISYLKYVDSEAMKNAYEKYLVNKKGSSNIGRKVYGHIMALAENDLCPYCLQGKVTTVDHYLPKAYFISYSITPINLLPCCSDCNKNKNDIRVLQENKMFINPYFDNLQNIKWLGCKVNEDWPITFTYFVREDIENDILKERITIHFNTLKLGSLYASNALTHFRGRVKEIVKEYNSNDFIPPIESLRSSKESIEDYNLNSWEAKIYEALLHSKWFLNIAIKELEEKYNVPKEGGSVRRELYQTYF
ncbi:TPA: HNH endonuclease signature motif containing protein [Bacillus cereus]|uniref:HNH endonuclease signature motif containing protein n=1 Tax=Bacillus cereus TaxID=1396 RepID=UPI0013D3DE58|nr:HNH endonuclease signature motif containing protein [Bacillus cereus]MDA2379501.1 HNH endonuclease signature motif containing protein [Bacillus cereus]